MIEYPNIDPVAISIPISGFWGESINIYWYGLAYVVGAYLIYLRMLQTRSKFNIQMEKNDAEDLVIVYGLLCACLLYTSPSPRDKRQSRMPSSA